MTRIFKSFKKFLKMCMTYLIIFIHISRCPCGECKQTSAYIASLPCCHQTAALWHHLDNHHMVTMATDNNHSDSGYSSDVEKSDTDTLENSQYSCVTQHPGFQQRYLDTTMLQREAKKFQLLNRECSGLPKHR